MAGTMTRTAIRQNRMPLPIIRPICQAPVKSVTKKA